MKAEVAILASIKANIRAKTITSDGRGHYITTKGSGHQEDMAILNVYGINNKAAKYVKQKLIDLKGETDKPTSTVGDFNIPISIIDETKIAK